MALFHVLFGLTSQCNVNSDFNSLVNLAYKMGNCSWWIFPFAAFSSHIHGSGIPLRLGTKSVEECWNIVRDESSVYFNVTAKHVWYLVATVYKPTVPCMITIELSDIWLISEAIYHLIFTQDPLNWSLESPPQHRDDFVIPTFLYRVKKQPKMLTLVKICICAT